MIIGNPPFAGKNTLIAGHQKSYPDWLKTIHEESHGNADLVAHFFRRAFALLRPDGCMGLIATNTIGQGDTRSTGLRWICQNGGTIYRATKRLKWPGEAAVIVSVVHMYRGTTQAPIFSTDVGGANNGLSCFTLVEMTILPFSKKTRLRASLGTTCLGWDSPSMTQIQKEWPRRLLK